MLHNIVTHKIFSALIPLEKELDTLHGDTPLTEYTSFSPTAIVEEAQINLIALSHMMYRVHGTEKWYTPLMGILTHLAHTILPQIQKERQLQSTPITTSSIATEALRATFIMCVKGLWDQGLNTYVAETMFHLAYELLDEEDAAIISRSTGLSTLR